MAFGGGGIHFCHGATLARLELSVLLGEMLDRGLSLSAEAPPEFVRSNFVTGTEHFHVAACAAR